MRHEIGMIEQRIHEANPPQLVDQGHVPFRCLNRPGEGPRIAGPGTVQFPADPRPEPVITPVQSRQQSGLHGKTEAPL